MLTLNVPVGVSLQHALVELLPKWHRQLVPVGRKHPDYVAVVKVRGEDGGVFTVRVRGQQMTVSAGEDSDRDLWILTDDYVVRYLLDDMSEAHAFVPRALAEGAPVRLISDPLMVERAKMSPGVVHFSLYGVPGTDRDLWVAMGVGKRQVRYIDEQEPNLKLRVPFDLFKVVAKGKIKAPDAISSPKVQLEGSRLLAMQLALISTLLVPAERQGQTK